MKVSGEHIRAVEIKCGPCKIACGIYDDTLVFYIDDYITDEIREILEVVEIKEGFSTFVITET